MTDFTVPRALRYCAERIYALPGVERAMLFGSYAKGTARADSDIDLAVFFSTVKSCLLDEYRALVRICSKTGLDIQVQVFDVCELSEPCGIVEEIVRYGVELEEVLRRGL